jgi:hypothetical protein
MAGVDDSDGSRLLTSVTVGALLSAAVAHAGGSLVSWHLEHVDADPHRSTTATYAATVDWPYGRRVELLGASARVSGRSPSDEQAVMFADGEREVAVWLYPGDPDLPGLARAASATDVAALFTAHRVVGAAVRADQVELTMVGYRPRRRAVLRARIATASGPQVFFIKVLRQPRFAPTVRRHELLRAAAVPTPEIALATDDFLLVLRELPGQPLAQAIFDPQAPCSAEALVALLDAMPAEAARLQRRHPWTDAVDSYAAMVAVVLPPLEPRLAWLVDQIRSGLADRPPGDEATHGDFHEGQLFVANGRIRGVLDIDTVGPGRRADDLACLLAHLSTVQRMNAEQSVRVSALIQSWVPVFDTRVDPIELRLRAAGVAVSLATGPYRGQEPAWEHETTMIIAAAERLVRSAAC